MALLEVTLGWTKNELQSNVGRVCKQENSDAVAERS